jgi:hypothetical protein
VRHPPAGVFAQAILTGHPAAAGVGDTATIAALLGVAGSASLQIAADPSGNVELIATGSVNPGFGAFGVGGVVGGVLSTNTGTNVTGFNGPSLSFSSGGGPAQGTISFGQNSTTISGTYGLGFGGRSSSKLGFGVLKNFGPLGQLFPSITAGSLTKFGAAMERGKHKGSRGRQLSERCDQCCLESFLT